MQRVKLVNDYNIGKVSVGGRSPSDKVGVAVLPRPHSVAFVCVSVCVSVCVLTVFNNYFFFECVVVATI